MKTEIRVDGCLDVPRTLQRFHLFGEDPANRLSPGVFRRAVKVAGRWRGYEVRWSGSVDGARLVVSTPGERSARVLEAAAAEAARICGLGLDVGGFYGVAQEDPVLGLLVPRLRGLRPTLAPQPFEMLVGSVCAQQVNLRWAAVVRARLAQRYGKRHEVGQWAVWSLHPAPLASARFEDLRTSVQLTGAKAVALVGCALGPDYERPAVPLPETWRDRRRGL